ncbi:MAG: hypothetical protein U0Q55_04475 [Vicinamibacterales bacterium]
MRALLSTSLAAAAATATAVGLAATSGAALPVRSEAGEAAPFYAMIESDRRHDHAGLGTAIVAGTIRLLVDASPSEGSAMVSEPADVLLLTTLDRVATDRLLRLMAAPRTAVATPLQVFGPEGTGSLMRQVASSGGTRGARLRPVVTVDVTGGVLDVGSGVTVRAVTVAASHVAYLVRFDGRGLLVAKDVTSSCPFEALTDPIDLAVVRHTNEVRAAGLLGSIGAPRAVLAQDGAPASASGIRESYGGSFEFARAGIHRVAVPSRPKLRQEAQRVTRVASLCS